MSKQPETTPIVTFRVHSGRGAVAMFNSCAGNIFRTWPALKCAVVFTTTRVYFTPDLTAPGILSSPLRERKYGGFSIYSAIFREKRLTGKKYKLHYRDDGALYINRYKPLE